jgi:uncharacterized protein (TIGR00106 family)
MSVIVQFTIFPMDVEGSLAPYVARAVAIIRASGLPFTLGPMGTTIEGTWDDIMKVVNDCREDLESDCGRVYLSLTADSRKGRINGMASKVASVLAQEHKPPDGADTL